MTIKPADLFIHVRRRPVTLAAADPVEARQTPSPLAPSASAPNGVPIRVLFGSNAGTSEAFAQRILTDARLRGYDATIGSLDSAVDRLPPEGAVVVVCSSYEGQPPDNAAAFVSWLRQLPDDALAGRRFAVFGNGNRD